MFHMLMSLFSIFESYLLIGLSVVFIFGLKSPFSIIFIIESSKHNLLSLPNL